MIATYIPPTVCKTLTAPTPQDNEELRTLLAVQYPPAEPPIDFPKELGINIAALPYRATDPLGWVRDIANAYWLPVEALLRHAISLKPDIEYTALPGCAHNREWCRYDVQAKQWVPVGASGLPELVVPDIESLREGKGTPTRVDPYRPFLCTALGCDRTSSVLSWYCWRDHLTGEPLPEVIPFPQDRVVINQNVTAYDRRYFSCEYEQVGPSTNVYLDTRVLGILMHGISDQAEALHKVFKKSKAAGLPVPYWVTQASQANLADLVEHRLGVRINKSVRDNFEKLTASELAAKMYAADNLEVTPTSVHTYCAQDVHWTWLLWCDLWQEFDARFVSHPATYSGMGLLGAMRVYMDGLDEFIGRNDAAYAEVREREIAGVIRQLADAHLDRASALPEAKAYTEINARLTKARVQEEALTAKKSALSAEHDKAIADLHGRYPEMAKLAAKIEQHKAEIKRVRKDFKFASGDKGAADARIADLKSEYQVWQKQYRALSKRFHDETDESTDTFFRVEPDKSVIALRKKLERVAADLKEIRDLLKAVLLFKKEHIAEHERLYFEYVTACEVEVCSWLDWSTFSSGPRVGQVKWYAELEEKGFSAGGRDAVYLLGFLWKGEPICWERERLENGASSTVGTWVTNTESLPHLGGGERLGSPLCTDYVRFVHSGELKSKHLTKDALIRLYEAMENTGQWRSYQSRYKQIYRVTTEHGLLTTTDALPGGTVSGRATSSTFLVAPKKSDKIGSDVQDYFGPGRDRVVVERDFAAQESKFLAMASDAIAGQNFHSKWSGAVLRGEKSKGTDIHTLVAGYCSEGMKEGEAPVTRQDGKTLNFASVYLCGEAKLAGGLIQKSNYPAERAHKVAERFMRYIKGPDGIALDEFSLLNRCANTPGYRTLALSRKIADSIDYAHCPDDFHTTRANWTIQSGCTDLLHITVTVLWALCQEYEIDAFLLITVHDSVKYSVRPVDVPLFERLLDFAHATAKQCAYQGAIAWAREVQQQPAIPSLWCPRQDIYFEKE